MQKHRKLAAIMFTDIVGYTAIMAKSEHKALGILHRHRDILKPLISEFNGEWLKEMGDGTLSSFASVVDAVNCAIEIQNSLMDETEFKLRIGIHIGDVVVEEGDVFGDGVNVASRIENLAEPGGICISGRVYEDIRNKPDIEAVLLGEKRLKNVEQPVKVYALKREHISEPPSKPSDKKHIEKAPRKTLYILIILAVIGIIGGYAIYSRYGVKEEPVPETTAPVTEKKLSIAVLPLYDYSPQKDKEHICEGIADAIILALQSVKALHVISRNSAFVFKGEHRNIGAIGDSLNADYVLESSLQIEGNRWRIINQLIKAADDYHVWGHHYDFEGGSIFAIQDSISLAIVDTLKIELQIEEKAAIKKRYTENVEAYNLYLQGRFHWYKRNYEGYMTALDYFQEALEKDSTYAIAYTGIADTYNLLTGYGHISSDEAIPETKKAVKRAMEIDNMLAEVHLSFATVLYQYDWDWTHAENEFKRALEINPGNAMVHHFYNAYLRAVGRFDESLEEIKIALELDPLSPIKYSLLSETYVLLGRFDEAMEACNKGLEIDQNFGLLHKSIGDIFLVKENYKDAIKAYQRAKELTKGYDMIEGTMGYSYGLSGEIDKAEQILNELIERKTNEYVSPISIALIYFGLKDYERGFDWLERACEKRVLWLPFIMTAFKYNPVYTHVTQNPRYETLLKKMGLPE